MTEQGVVLLTALGLGVVHTLAGPDHYVPFIALARAQKWPLKKSLLVTASCGVGHILSSVALALMGSALGATLDVIKLTDAWRGEVTAWLLIVFGLIYAAWGWRKAAAPQAHTHRHTHGLGIEHIHFHAHRGGHHHFHLPSKKPVTLWVLLIIFFFGPCEPLIPLVFYPAVLGQPGLMWAVLMSFGLTTILTMLTVVTVAALGFKVRSFNFLGRYAHVAAGLTIFCCGGAIKWFNL